MLGSNTASCTNHKRGEHHLQFSLRAVAALARGKGHRELRQNFLLYLPQVFAADT
jgi:hypothetical protein